MRIPKRVKRIGISSAILFVGFFVAGFVYVYYSDKTPTTNADTTQVSTKQYKPITPPPKPGPNADVGVAVEAFDSPVAPGANTSMIITTTPTATCSITVTYKNGVSKDPALAPKTADAYGNVTWTWNVPANNSLGNWPVNITCRLGKKWAVYDANLVVTQ